MPCCVVGCKAIDWRRVKPRHILPTDPTLRAAWLRLIGHSEASLPENPRVCGRHFAPGAYNYNPAFVESTGVGMCRLHLMSDSLPTLFLPKTEVSCQVNDRLALVTTEASQVLVMQWSGASESAATPATSQGPVQKCSRYVVTKTTCTQTTREHRSIATQANRTLKVRASVQTQTKAPGVAAVGVQTEPSWAHAGTL